jgi:hypothetical protein
MESRGSADLSLTSDAAEFVRFCYRRTHRGWPELYDEMCHVASHASFRGWGSAELEEHGVGFGLFDTPALAALVIRVLEAEGERRPRAPLEIRPAAHLMDEEPPPERRRTFVRALRGA